MMVARMQTRTSRPMFFVNLSLKLHFGTSLNRTCLALTKDKIPIATVKRGGGSAVVWRGFPEREVGQLAIIESMNYRV